jgi:sigma-B regulation protein RsbU (phosphoserine phosphatase)
MTGCRLRLWRFGRGRLRPVAQCDDVEPPPVRVDGNGEVHAAHGDRCIEPVPGLDGYWFEITEADGATEDICARIGPLLGRLLDAERETLHLAKQLAAQYEEIELLYTISEVLGRVIGVREAAQTILQEVSAVVGARRASILVYDERDRLLKPVASVGKPIEALSPIPAADPSSITARVFRERRIAHFDPRHDAGHPGSGEDRGYRGEAFISVPVVYRSLDGAPRPIGVMNLTDRVGSDAFSGGERRLMAAVANQIGAAIEHARLVERDFARQRMERELELAHDLHLKLLPNPALLGPGVDIAAQCEPAERVGGDFYHFVRLPGRRIGVMLGDVSSHGFAAAMIMALVRAAAGIHVAEVTEPDEALRRLVDSVADELEDTEMFLTLFYGVVDPEGGVLRYANAGHPHAFRIPADGSATRLGATSPPLGVAAKQQLVAAETAWVAGEDLLLLFSDGLMEAQNGSGTPFGEDRVVGLVRQHRTSPSRSIVDRVIEAVDSHEIVVRDDRTVLVLRA